MENKWGEKMTFAQSLAKERYENWVKKNPDGMEEKRKTANSRDRKDQHNKYNIQQRGR